MKIHSNNRKAYKCEFCTKEFLCGKAYRSHILSHTKSKADFSCDQCERMFYSKHALGIHVRSKHNMLSIPCEVCGKTYPSKFKLDLHVESEHLKTNHELECEICSKKYPTRHKLLLHQYKHRIGEEKRKCTVEGCCVTFSHLSSLKIHLQTEHEGKRFHCIFPGCSTKYTGKHKLKAHLSKHTTIPEELEFYESQLKHLKLV